MGNLLGAPVTEKETHEGVSSDQSLQFAVSTMQGWRVHMEDAHILEPCLYAYNPTTKTRIDLPGHALFAVFDGHGGTFAAAYAGRNLCRVLSRQPKFVQYAEFELQRPQRERALVSATERNNLVRSGLDLLEAALCDALVDMDREIACALKGTKVPEADQPYHTTNSGSSHRGGSDGNNTHDAGSSSHMQLDGTHGDVPAGSASPPPDATSPADSALQLLEEEGDSGTTVCVVLVTNHYILCANAGDSRSVISRLGNKAIPLSYDHKPEDEEEERRIRAAGGYVAGGRVEGDLAVSRGLGDFRFKNMDVVMAATSNYRHGETQSQQAPQQQSSSNHHALAARQPVLPGDQKVSPIPDIVIHPRNPAQDEFILIACDGIWDVLTNYEAVQIVAELFKDGESSLGLVCEEVRADRVWAVRRHPRYTTMRPFISLINAGLSMCFRFSICA